MESRSNDALVSAAQLIEFLGVDADSHGIVDIERRNALDEVRRSTGVDWAARTERVDTINELVQTMVYLSYYGVRDGLKNLDHLERRKHQLMTLLQYSEEVWDGLHAPGENP